MSDLAADARAGAFDVLMRIEAGGYANLALDDYLEGPGQALSGRDRALLTGLVQGVVKHRLTLDWLIDQKVNHLSRLKTGPRILLRLGLYQLYFLDGIPTRAATYETVELAKRRFHSGVASLVNGALRAWIREGDAINWPDEKQDPAGFLSIRHSHPRWMVERWIDRYGYAQTESLCQYNNEPPELWLRANTLKIRADELAAGLEAEGCRTKPGDYAPEALALLSGPGVRRLESFREGLFAVQDESSMMAAHGLDPQPGQRVLDACAAPGGKTTHIAQLMEDRGEIVAWDVHPHRIGLIRQNQRRLGLRCIRASVRDAAAGNVNVGVDLAAADGVGRLFERILVDAPCSGLGALRRRADARWNRKPEDIQTLAEVQEKLLHNTLSLLAPGGRLLYSTCTTEPEENRLLVEKALRLHRDCRKGALTLPVTKEENRSLLPNPARDWDVQFLPFIHGLEGFYMAAIEKTKE